MHRITHILTGIYCILVPMSCNTLKDHPGVSENISESKRRGVYISEYYTDNNPYIINDSLRLHIKSAWIEKSWAYPENNYDTRILPGYQLIIDVEEQDLIGYGRTWMIGIDGNKYFRSCRNNCLMSDCELILQGKTTWYVQQGRRLDTLSSKTIIGEFSLIKKD
ncbi:hypothetical protein JNM05_06425 [bacterium]|nr:hypothetical protein [bacterium]